jgi:hypothetical protein
MPNLCQENSDDDSELSRTNVSETRAPKNTKNTKNTDSSSPPSLQSLISAAKPPHSSDIQHIPTQTAIYLFISSICATLNHHGYLFLLVISAALIPQHVSMLLILVGLLHILTTGAALSIMFGMRENPELSRSDRFARQHGHTLMLTHFGGCGSIAELYRVWIGVEGCTVEGNVLRSIFFHFLFISPIKIVILVFHYIKISTNLEHIINNLTTLNSNNNDRADSIDINIILANDWNVQKLYYIGYGTFLVLLSTFLFIITSYVFSTTLNDGNDDGDLQNDLQVSRVTFVHNNQKGLGSHKID